MPLPPFDENTYIPHRMRHTRRSQAIYISLLLGVAAMAVAVCTVKVEVSVQSRGIITTQQRPSQVMCATYGRVASVRMAENALVQQGDTLVVLDPTDMQQSIALSEQRAHMLEQEVDDLQALTSMRNDLSRLRRRRWASVHYKQEFQKALSDQEVQQNEVRLAAQDHKRQLSLYKQGHIAPAEYEQADYRLRAARLRLQQMQENQQAEWQAALTASQNQLLQLREAINGLGLERNKRYITAPTTGHVQGLMPLREGTVLFANQQLCTISPADGLMVETYVSPADIGFVHTGQRVNVRIDAFNSSQWGQIGAEVAEIAADASSPAEGAVAFRVLCAPQALTLHHGDKTASVKKGMTLTASFVLARRTLAQIMVDDMASWLNPNIIAEP
ncbi:MAG: HlyD family efflux transporter periplasmic adaptor subunit [Bacteroidales bacterium]|nr:HlyD family efflux transporter periplasmic adaptor subunit [Bacteroidales bacterium]